MKEKIEEECHKTKALELKISLKVVNIEMKVLASMTRLMLSEKVVENIL